jgi:hypothetical protein
MNILFRRAVHPCLLLLLLIQALAYSLLATAAVGPATHLAFIAQPQGLSGPGEGFITKVAVEDANGSVVTQSSASVTMAIGANPGNSTLSGTTTINAVNGVATFSSLSLDKVGNGYTLVASNTGLTSATSGDINIYGPATKLVFLSNPPNSWTVFHPFSALMVAEDSTGNQVKNYSVDMTVALTQPDGGAILSGNKTISPSNGSFMLTGLSIDKVGSYTLTANSGNLPSSISTQITVGPDIPAKFVFTAQPPANSALNAPFTAAVSVEDVNGNVVTTDNSTVNLTLRGGTPGALLSGGSMAAVNGVATFTNLKVDTAGNSYKLNADDGGTLMAATSNDFNIVPTGPATKLVFTAQPPASSAINAAFTATVSVEDANSNVVTSDTSNVTVALTTPNGATLSGTKTVAAVAGVAKFTGLSVDKAGTYTLTATDGNLSNGVSASFTITVGAATKLGFGQQPTNTALGASITPAVTVQIQDANGNVVTTSAASVTLAMGSNPGGSTLGGTKTVAAVNGIATFSNLSLDKMGVGYTLTGLSVAPPLTSATSSAFNIVGSGAAAKLVFTTQPPASSAVNTPFTATVSVEDANGNVVTTDNSMVNLTLGGGAPGALLSGGSVTAVNGVATFTNLKVDTIGSSYKLNAADGALTGAASNNFDIATADLAISKTHTGDFTQGQNGATYTIVVSNVGGVSTTGSIVVTDTLPAGLTATAIVGSGGWSCQLATVKCTLAKSVSAGASAPSIAVTVNVAGNASSPLINVATVTNASDSNSTNNTTSDVTTVDQVAQQPIAIGDGIVVNSGGSTSVINGVSGLLSTVLANDFNPNVNAFGQQMTATIVSGPSHGTLTPFNSDGSLTYQNSGDVATTDSFQYKACDTLNPALCSTTTVKINIFASGVILPQVYLPEAVNDAATVGAGSSTSNLFDGSDTVLANDYDPNVGGVLLASQVGPNPTKGTLQFNLAGKPSGSFTYANQTNATQDGFYYQACDSLYGACGLATVTITIGQPPSPVLLPVAVDDEIQVAPSGTKSVLIGGSSTVLWNDTDPNNANNDNSTLQAWLLGSGPQHGTLQFNKTASGDGTFTYQHNGGGTSDSFAYQACDTTYGACAAATVSIEITNSPSLNQLPEPMPDTITVAGGGASNVLSSPSGATSVLANDTDPDASETATLKAFLLGSGPQHGTLALSSDGKFSYANNLNDPATSDSFVYEACDVHGACAATTVTINIGSGQGPGPTVSCMLPTQVYLAGAVSPDGTTDVVNLDMTKLFVPPAGESLNFSIDVLTPPLVMNAGTGLLNGTLGPGNAGSVMATLKATVAPAGASTTQTVRFDVLGATDHVFRNGFDIPPQNCQ